MADLIDETTLREFVEEVREHIVVLNRDFLELEDKGAHASADLVNEAFRAIHTIKGLSGMLGLTTVNELAHRMEDALSTVRQGNARVEGTLSQALFDALDLLGEMINTAARGTMPQQDTSKIIARLGDALSATEAASEEAVASAPGGERWSKYTRRGLSIIEATLKLAKDTSQNRRELLGTLEGLHGLGEVLSIDPEDAEKKLRARKKMKSFKMTVHLATRLTLEDLSFDLNVGASDIKEIAAPRVASDSPEESDAPKTEAAASSGPAAAEEVSGAIRVDAAKLDRVLALVGELVILRSRYHHVASQALGFVARTESSSRGVMALQSELNEVESTMSRTLGELQDAVMKARLVPIGTAFGRLRRTARDVAAKKNRQVRFETTGGEIELDKKVIDQISAPLTHLVRNSVDHGIEEPSARAAAGKPKEGRVMIAVRQEGDRVIIEVRDDGKGLDRSRIIGKAVQRGLLGAEEARDVTETDLADIICSPGFSTAAEVTDVSGRGVGMDVVKETVSGLKGSFDITSVSGAGSAFRISLPLTMAIMDALLVSVSGETYAIAVSSVREIQEKEGASIHAAGGTEFIQTIEKAIPLVRLTSALNAPSKNARQSNETIVVVDSHEGQVGLIVDEVLGQQEIVVKSLSRRFESVSVVSGGSVLGDGSVCLILDVPSLVAAYGQNTAGDLGAAE
jgi:two-component system chemotaxis sensor kinase CheA